MTVRTFAPYSSPLSWLAGVFDAAARFEFVTRKSPRSVCTRVYIRTATETLQEVVRVLEELKLPQGAIVFSKGKPYWALPARDQVTVLSALAPHVKACYPSLSKMLEMRATTAGRHGAKELFEHRRALALKEV